MIPEDIQRLLEGNHQFLLAALLFNSKSPAVVAEKEPGRSLASHCGDLERGVGGLRELLFLYS